MRSDQAICFLIQIQASCTRMVLITFCTAKSGFFPKDFMEITTCWIVEGEKHEEIWIILTFSVHLKFSSLLNVNGEHGY